MKRWKVYMLCAVCVLCIGLLTGCGARDKNGTVNTERNTGALNNERTDDRENADGMLSGTETDRTGGSGQTNDGINDGVNDATGDDIAEQNDMTDDNRTDNNDTGIGNAVEDIADGVGEAGKDIVDGIGEAGDSLTGDNRTDQTNQNAQKNDAAGME